MKDPNHVLEQNKQFKSFPDEQNLFAALVQIAPQRVLVFDESLKLCFANQQAIGFFQHTLDQITLSFFSQHYLDGLDLLQPIDSVKRGSLFTHEAQLKIGENYIPSDLRMIFYQGKVAGYFVVTLYEIIEKRFEALLIKEKNKLIESLARFPEENPNAVLRFDAQLALLYANPVGKKFYDSLQNLKAHQQLLLLENAISHTLRQDKLVSLEITIDKSYFQCELLPNQPEGYVNIYVHDITKERLSERKNEEVLKQQVLLSEISFIFNRIDLTYENKVNVAIRKIGTFFNLSRISFFELDSDQITASLTFEWCNDRVQSLKEDLIEVPLEFIPVWKEMLDQDDALFSSHLEVNHDYWRGIIHRTPVLSTLLSPVTDGEVPFGFLSFEECSQARHWDDNSIELIRTTKNLISNEYQRKLDHQTLIRSKLEAEAASKAKEVFLANMSHEIRTPMNVIIGMGNLLFDTHLEEKQKGYLQAIKVSAENLLVIINDILDFSKIQAGKIELEEIPFNLRELVSIIMNSQTVRASEKSLIMECRFDEGIYPGLLGDPFRLNQILLNLLNNAVKFTEKGSILLTCKLIDESPSSNTIYFEVKDTGQGIAHDKMEQIFASFQQGDPSITRKYGGTGLGLTITKELVRLFGATIEMQSEVGVGTSFFFTITFSKSEKPVDDPKKKNPIDKNLLRGKRVLLVEDNEFNRLVAISLLEQWNVTIETAVNGKIALDMLQERTYDVILMDIQMPVMDGLEATEIIREQMHLKIPIIALTANALKSDKDRYLACGMNEYISKPFNPVELFHCLARILNLAKDSELPKIKEPLPTLVSERLFDLTKLEQISAGDQEFFIKMVRLFLSQSEENIEKLSHFGDTGDVSTLKAIVHKMKPSVNIMGINAILNIISKIEKLEGGANLTLEPQRLTDQLIALLETICEGLKEAYPD